MQLGAGYRILRIPEKTAPQPHPTALKARSVTPLPLGSKYIYIYIYNIHIYKEYLLWGLILKSITQRVQVPLW